MYALIYVSTYCHALHLVAKRREIKSFITLHEIKKNFSFNTITFSIKWTTYGKILVKFFSKILGKKCRKNHMSLFLKFLCTSLTFY